MIHITVDPEKRERSLADRGLDFADAAQVVQPHKYRDLPELREAMLPRAVVKKGGRPRSLNPRKLITLRLPEDVLEQWRATGPGWQTRMAERLRRVPTAARRGAQSNTALNRSRPGKTGRTG